MAQLPLVQLIITETTEIIQTIQQLLVQLITIELIIITIIQQELLQREATLTTIVVQIQIILVQAVRQIVHLVVARVTAQALILLTPLVVEDKT